MIRSASQIRAAARTNLAGKWGGAVILTLIYMLVMGGLPMLAEKSSITGMSSIIQLLLYPIVYGYGVAFLENARNGNGYKINQLFDGFHDYMRIFGTLILSMIYIILWMFC